MLIIVYSFCLFAEAVKTRLRFSPSTKFFAVAKNLSGHRLAKFSTKNFKLHRSNLTWKQTALLPRLPIHKKSIT